MDHKSINGNNHFPWLLPLNNPTPTKLPNSQKTSCLNWPWQNGRKIYKFGRHKQRHERNRCQESVNEEGGVMDTIIQSEKCQDREARAQLRGVLRRKERVPKRQFGFEITISNTTRKTHNRRKRAWLSSIPPSHLRICPSWRRKYNTETAQRKHHRPQKCVRRSTQVVQAVQSSETHGTEGNMFVMW